VQCGWLKDKFGVSWQIVPEVLPKMLNEKDRDKSKRVMEAMMQMVRLDIDALQKAYYQSA
jgi:predicted 3-demethylubiquinone-9 3-methyltransferase (glyoxalase superfamily)